jgi:homoserine dehydrogenase
MIASRSADVMVELTPTNLESGEPATSHITAALNRGMHVITANKGPAALHLTALRALAAQKGLFLGIEGTVMAGTPSLRLGWSSLAGADITRVRGIVNGTTNYILTQMEQGLDYAAALADAQKIGYAEADPTGDVEGHDAAGKAAILANVLMNAGIRPSDVATTGITGISAADVAAAQAAGERWKLIAEVSRGPDGIKASVQPMRLPNSHPLAGVSGGTNALTYTTDFVNDVTIIGPGAGALSTGFAVVGDLLALHRGERERANT